MKIFGFLMIALALTACGKMDYTNVTAKPGETYVIVGNIDQVGGGLDPMVEIMANEACVGGDAVRVAVEKVSNNRANHTFTCND